MESIVTRFAPSPTGYLHIGGLRTALFNYLYARKNNGKFLLRIEDTDLARNSKDAAKAIIESFKWVGLEHDGEIVYQSERFDLYREYAQKLLDSGAAYYCYMSKEELDMEREKAGVSFKYDRRYRDFKGTPPNVAPSIRIKAPLSGEISFKDGVKGEIKINAKELDDFIILRSDGVPTYNFVVAVDDALMGVTDVIRGDDHTSNTPKQILVYQALNFKIPRFFHVPMILNPEGRKLSKRDGAMGVMDYKAAGYLPESILNFLVRLGWSYGDKEIFSLDEMKELFDVTSLNSSPSIYNVEKFLWLNQVHIKQYDNNKLEELLKEFGLDSIPSDKRDVLFNALKDRSKTLIEFKNSATDVLNAPKEYDEKMLKKLDSSILEELKILSESSEFLALDSVSKIDEFLHNFAESRSLKLGKFMPALRLALLGKSGGIGLNEAIFIIGANEAKNRIEAFLKH